jgi:hypothetical protein
VQVREGILMSAQPIKQVLTSEVTGAWLESYDPGDRKFIKIGFLLLENGQTLSDITIAYQTWGTLNAAGDNAILIQHAMTGWSDVPGWWPNMVGPGLAFDTNKYFVVCPNVIGGCQGSTGPSSIAPDGKRYGSRFPAVTIRDMVAAEIAFSDAIGIKKYKLAVGPSLGGMRSLEWQLITQIAWNLSARLDPLLLQRETKLELHPFRFVPSRPIRTSIMAITTSKSVDPLQVWELPAELLT